MTRKEIIRPLERTIYEFSKYMTKELVVDRFSAVLGKDFFEERSGFSSEDWFDYGYFQGFSGAIDVVIQIMEEYLREEAKK